MNGWQAVALRHFADGLITIFFLESRKRSTAQEATIQTNTLNYYQPVCSRLPLLLYFFPCCSCLSYFFSRKNKKQNTSPVSRSNGPHRTYGGQFGKTTSAGNQAWGCWGGGGMLAAGTEPACCGHHSPHHIARRNPPCCYHLLHK